MAVTTTQKPSFFRQLFDGLFHNPIIHREMLSSLRTKKAIAMQVLFLLVVAGLILLYWPKDGLQDLFDVQAKQIFSIIAVGELLMVTLFAPAFTAASLTTEKEHGTFESVFTTAMKPWEIAIGKMVGSLTFLILLVLSGVPALCAPFLMGGVEGRDVLNCILVLLLTAIWLGLIGLLVSSYMHRSYRAIIVTYAILGIITFFFAMPAWPISGHLINRPDSEIVRGILHTMASLSPMEAMLSLIWPTSEYATGAQGMPKFYELYIPLSVVGIVITAAICLIKLHQPIAPPRPREKLKIVERGKVTARTFLFLVDPRKRKRMIAWWQNPVLVKEFRTRPMMQAQWLLRAFFTCLVSSVILMIIVTISLAAVMDEGADMIGSMFKAIAALMVVTVILVGPAMSGGTICGDIETGVWDLMRTTRLSSWRIVSGKFMAALIPIVLITAAMVPPLVFLLYFQPHNWVNTLRVLEVVFMTLLFVATTGMFFSSVFLKTATATAWTYGVVVTLGLLTLLVLISGDRFSADQKAFVLALNPVAAALDASGNPVVAAEFTFYLRYLITMGIATVSMILVTVLRVLQLRRAD